MNIHEYDYSSRFHSQSKARISTARKLQGLFQRATSMLVTDVGDEMCRVQSMKNLMKTLVQTLVVTKSVNKFLERNVTVKLNK